MYHHDSNDLTCYGCTMVTMDVSVGIREPRLAVSIWRMYWCVLLVLYYSVSAEMLGYSYELDSPFSGVKNRAVPNIMMRSILLPLQTIRANIQVIIKRPRESPNQVQQLAVD